jgi:hypothetical protein
VPFEEVLKTWASLLVLVGLRVDLLTIEPVAVQAVLSSTVDAGHAVATVVAAVFSYPGDCLLDRHLVVSSRLHGQDSKVCA